MPEELIRRKRRLSSFQIITLGFAGVILLGALLLMLPISTTGENVTPFNETLFTATSAVCVTGLVVQDTGCYWSTFGQAVILALIQIGGLGVVTVAASFALLSGRKISLMQRSTMQDAISTCKMEYIMQNLDFRDHEKYLVIMNRYRGDEMNCYMQSELQAQFPVKEKVYETETPLGSAEQLAALEGIKKLSYMFI